MSYWFNKWHDGHTYKHTDVPSFGVRETPNGLGFTFPILSPKSLPEILIFLCEFP